MRRAADDTAVTAYEIGARTLAALGVSLPLIQLMVRWSSDVVMTYVSEAPLVNMTVA